MVLPRHARTPLSGLALAGVVLLAMVVMAIRTVRSFYRTADLVVHTQEVRFQLNATFGHLKEFHNATRAYLQSGDERLLPARDASLEQFKRTMPGLRQLMLASPTQDRSLSRVTGLVPRFVSEYDRFVELRRSGRAGAIASQSAEARRLAEEILALSAALQAEETRLLEERIALARREAGRTVGVLVGGLVLDVILVCAVVLMLRREARTRHAATTALEHERRLLGELMDNVTESIYFKDRESRFTRANRGLAARFGVDDPAVLIGKRDSDFFTSAHAQRALADELEVMRTGQPINKEEAETWPDGRTTWALTAKLPLRDASGAIVGTFGLSRDITARKEAEHRLEQAHAALAARSRELEEANRELEAFSYSVSHDLRAPLRHIDYFAAMLPKQIDAAHLDDKSRRYLTTISTSARNMGQLIDDLLAFARIGRVALQRARVDLNALVAETRQALQTEIDGRAVHWSLGPLPEVQGDAALLRQVFANLLGNAVKYSRGRPEARIEVGTQPGEPGEVVVYVRDNGAGFDMKYAEKLFGVFQRLHAASEFEGTGVGLANVRRIIQRHGGRTWAEGAVDRGATFYFSLPHAKA